MLRGLVVVLAFLALVARGRGQELQFTCIACGDIFDRCELDCSWSLLGSSVADVTACHAGCLEAKSSCTDSKETLKCSLCVLECGQTYDTDMRACLAVVSRSSKATYGDGLSECELLASFDSDSCMLKCKKAHDNLDDEYTDDVR